MIEDPADKLNDLIDQAIDALANDDPEKGADALTELAHVFAKAGTGVEPFRNIRQHIIQEAEKQTSAVLIKEKLTIIERVRRDGRIYGYTGQLKH